ncbi:MAG: sugar phosphate isomerase/epimerase [Anaerolineae bacterium]|nr:sugar phosphate isomerase/epimerase [Anaerolineae bacterium]
MKFGCCASIDQAEAVYRAGFDYLEAGVTSLIPDEDEASFVPVLEKYRASPIPVSAFNLFLPRDLKIVGPEIDRARMEQYVQRAVARIQAVGATIAVIGSGGSRSVPEGFSRSQATAQIVQFLQLVADAADQTDVTIAIEPLNRKESNIINSVAEGVAIARQVDRPSIRVLADFYHMDEDDEPLDTLTANQDWLAHIHVADSGRLAPGTGSYPYPEFVGQLRQAGYQGMVSVECRWNDFDAEAAPSVEFLRRAFQGESS